MSFIYRDMLGPAKALQQTFSAVRRKFDRAWSKGYKSSYNPWTGKIESVEVYANNLYFYKGGKFQDSLVLKRFLVAMGMDYEEFKDQPINSDIDKMWFYIKSGYKWDGTTGFIGWKDHDGLVPAKYDPSPELDSPSQDDIVNNINDVFKVDDEISITITYGGDLKRYIDEHELTWEATGIEIISGAFNSGLVQNKILSNPWYYVANSRHLPYDRDGSPFQIYNAGDYDMPTDVYRPANRKLPVCDVAISLKDYSKPAGGEEEPNIQLGLFALMASDSEWEPILDEDGSNIFDSKTLTSNTSKEEGEVLKHEFTLKFKFKGINPFSKYIDEISLWYENYYQDSSRIPIVNINIPADSSEYKELLITSTVDTKMKKAMVKMMTDSTKGFNSLYFNGQLRVEAVNQMKARDFSRLLGNSLDTDYDVKDASFFEIAFAIAIVVTAIVVGVLLAVPSGGQLTWATAAAGLAAASAILGVGQMMLVGFGGMRVQGMADKIGAFAQIVGIAAMIVGVMAAWEAAKEKALAEARQKALDEAQKAVGKDIITKAVMEAIIDKVSVSVLDVVKSAVNNAVEDALMTFSSSGSGGFISAANTTLDMAQKGLELYSDYEQKQVEEEYKELQAEIDELNEERDSQRVKADPLYVLIGANESLSSYDALSSMELDWKSKNSPDGFFNKFHSERTIA